MKANKLFYALALPFFAQVVFAQSGVKGKPFTINGSLTGAPVDSVNINYRDVGGYVSQTLPVRNNKFTITGSISHPVSAAILFKKAGEKLSYYEQEERTRQLFIEPKIISITGNVTDMQNLQISGSKTEAEFEELNAKLQPIEVEMKPISAEISKQKTMVEKAAMHPLLDPYLAKEKKLRCQFYFDHPNSYVTLYYMQVDVSDISLDSVKTIYNAYNDELKSTDEGKALALQIKTIESGMPGHKAPVFSKTDINGKQLSLTDFKGKYVMLDFWASWCVPCRAGNPHMISLYKKYHDKGFDVIGIADNDGDSTSWKSAVIKDSVQIWHHVLRGMVREMKMKGIDNPNDLSDQYGIASLPTKILIGPDGMIVGHFGDSYGGTDADMDKMLASIFNK